MGVLNCEAGQPSLLPMAEEVAMECVCGMYMIMAS